MVGLDNPLHLLFLLVIVLLLFGAKRLPEMGRSLGTGMRSFKDSLSGDSPGEPSQQLTENGSQTSLTEAASDSTLAVERVDDRLAA